jgi:hypothetical protein
MSQLRFVRVLALAVFITAMGFARGANAASAKVYNFKGSLSGTSAKVPLDITGDSCSVVGSVEICTSTSTLSTYGGSSTGGPPGTTGAFTGQSVDQTIPVAGMGCSFAMDTIKSCTIGSNTSGCEYTYVSVNGVGGAGANRITSSGDQELFYLTGGTFCYDGNTRQFQGTQTFETIGGTGKATGYTGTSKASFIGGILLDDLAGNGFSWFSQTFTGTLTK